MPCIRAETKYLDGSHLWYFMLQNSRNFSRAFFSASASVTSFSVAIRYNVLTSPTARKEPNANAIKIKNHFSIFLSFMVCTPE